MDSVELFPIITGMVIISLSYMCVSIISLVDENLLILLLLIIGENVRPICHVMSVCKLKKQLER